MSKEEEDLLLNDDDEDVVVEEEEVMVASLLVAEDASALVLFRGVSAGICNPSVGMVELLVAEERSR